MRTIELTVNGSVHANKYAVPLFVVDTCDSPSNTSCEEFDDDDETTKRPPEKMPPKNRERSPHLICLYNRRECLLFRSQKGPKHARTTILSLMTPSLGVRSPDGFESRGGAVATESVGSNRISSKPTAGLASSSSLAAIQSRGPLDLTKRLRTPSLTRRNRRHLVIINIIIIAAVFPAILEHSDHFLVA
uniref:Uncharacterized protein n=1 Tax=Plectus sambesii TaxID=2011161 RepID=A0A914V9X4_9BILA